MSESLLTVEAHVLQINPYETDSLLDPDDDRQGHVDVFSRLVEPLEDGGQNVFATAEVRVYFRRTDTSLDALISSALARGHEALSQIAQHYKSDPSVASPEQLWRQ
jgi:hypothetical protein